MKGTAARLVSAKVLLALASAVLMAQTTTSLTGTITDANGVPLANATVSLKNVGTGQTTTASTDPQGTYHFAGLASGDYELTASASGFAPKTSKISLGTTPRTEDIALGESTAP